MDDDHDLKDFGNVCRLFPLPGVVLLPHAVLPLHIFEPRYRQMTEDALAADRLIAIVQIRPPSEWPSPNEPSLEEFGCLGRIFKHERLADGRFNFLLLGRKRVRLTREIRSGKLYQMSEVEIVEDIAPTQPDSASRAELVASFRRLFKGRLDPDLDALFEGELPLGVLTDIIAQAMALPAVVKQTFLAEPRVDRRADGLLDLLRQLEQRPEVTEPDTDTDTDTPTFPPPFSLN
jgi:Lon protease-like protein